MVPLQIKGFLLDQEKMPIVVLCDEKGERVLPLWIGPSEANSIIVRLQDIKTPGPLAHDLLVDTFLRHGFRIDCLEIHSRSEVDGCAARLRYHRRGRYYQLEVRPSDGLALAVRLQVPVYACEELLAGANTAALMDCLEDPSRALLFLHAPGSSTSPAGGPPATGARRTPGRSSGRGSWTTEATPSN